MNLLGSILLAVILGASILAAGGLILFLLVLVLLEYRPIKLRSIIRLFIGVVTCGLVGVTILRVIGMWPLP